LGFYSSHKISDRYVSRWTGKADNAKVDGEQQSQWRTAKPTKNS